MSVFVESDDKSEYQYECEYEYEYCSLIARFIDKEDIDSIE